MTKHEKKTLVVKFYSDMEGADYAQIVEQSHKTDNFGYFSTTPNSFTHKGFTLKSMNNPAADAYNSLFYVRGFEAAVDLDLVKLPSPAFKASLIEAIAAYNAYEPLACDSQAAFTELLTLTQNILEFSVQISICSDPDCSVCNTRKANRARALEIIHQFSEKKGEPI